LAEGKGEEQIPQVYQIRWNKSKEEITMKHLDIEDRDFVIRVRPTASGDEWTGEIDISIISQGDNPLSDESYGQVMHFCKMMCATVPIMERDETVRDMVHNYVMEVVDRETVIFEEDEDDSLIITKEDGNVVHLSFGSRTKGSA
tara:strand:+ start:163 stop:594 length:432 start_codon:yes stop_codon:yes gene_type:complete